MSPLAEVLPLRVGVSACLLGEKVRFDGGHKLDPFIRDTLGRYCTFVPVCPEVGIGLPVPREALRLVGSPKEMRLISSRSQIDYTETMRSWSQRKAEELAGAGLCGFIFKSRSPSSGMERVKLYDGHGVPAPTGVGIFAGVLMRHLPELPVEEEGRLHDPLLRETFVEALFALGRWRQWRAGGESVWRLVEFHTVHKYQLMAHSPEKEQQLGRIVAAAAHDIAASFAAYETLLCQTLRTPARPSRQINVLHHLLGYFRNELSADEKAELLDLIERYRRGEVPLAVPVTLLRHYVHKYHQSYLLRQSYLQPTPDELKLRTWL